MHPLLFHLDLIKHRMFFTLQLHVACQIQPLQSQCHLRVLTESMASHHQYMNTKSGSVALYLLVCVGQILVFVSATIGLSMLSTGLLQCPVQVLGFISPGGLSVLQRTEMLQQWSWFTAVDTMAVHHSSTLTTTGICANIGFLWQRPLCVSVIRQPL